MARGLQGGWGGYLAGGGSKKGILGRVIHDWVMICFRIYKRRAPCWFFEYSFCSM